MRINKYLSYMGICSKKQADNLIKDGCVFVKGQPAVLGMQVEQGDEVMVNDQLVTEVPEAVFLLYHKPVGVVCTHDVRVANNIENAIQYPCRVFAVGRLDKASEGLMLLTNRGEVVNRLMRSENKHEKVYRVWVDKAITTSFVERIRQGVAILDTTTLPCKVEQVDEKLFEITLVQGLNRQIRRMCQVLGYRVERLQRIKILEFELDGIESNQIYKLTCEQQKMLLERIGLNLES